MSVAEAQKQPRPEELLLQIRETLDRMGPTDFGFTFEARDEAGELLGAGNGHFLAEGDCFRMTTPMLTVYCDGKTKWLCDMDNMEITIFPHDTASTDPAENPFAVLRKATPAGYDLKGPVRSVEHDGRQAYVLVMSPKDRNAAYTQVSVTVAADSRQPLAILYKSRNGDTYHLEVLSVKEVEELDGTCFVPPAGLLDDPDYIVTDMR